MRATARSCSRVGNDGQFAKLCEVLGHPELGAATSALRRMPARVRNLDALTPLLAARRQADRAHWVAALDAAGVPCGPINTVPEVFEEPQVKQRGMLIDLPHPLPGTVPQVASPMRFTEAPLKHERAAAAARRAHVGDLARAGLRRREESECLAKAGAT